MLTDIIISFRVTDVLIVCFMFSLNVWICWRIYERTRSKVYFAFFIIGNLLSLFIGLTILTLTVWKILHSA